MCWHWDDGPPTITTPFLDLTFTPLDCLFHDVCSLQFNFMPHLVNCQGQSLPSHLWNTCVYYSSGQE